MTFLRARSRAGARGAFPALRLPVAVLAVCTLAAALSACSPQTYQYGTPVVTIHASSGSFAIPGGTTGNFSSYKVGIASMYLTRTDGITASLLDGAPEEQVDLATIKDHPELVSAPAVPTGTYVNLTVTIDTGGASFIPPVIALNVNGQNTVVTQTNLLNSAGTGIAGSYQTFVLTFDPAHPFNVNQNQSFRLDFDMDLEASTIVDASSCAPGSSSCAPLVYANPVLQFTTTPHDSGLLRARGLLVVAQPSANNFIMNMHPFNDELYALGAMTVNVTPQTYYNINGQVVTGNQGLSLLQAIPISGNVLVYGTLDDLTNVGITPSMTATTVIGGTSLENYLQSHIQGVVASNTGSALTIAGATYVPNAFLLAQGACYEQFFPSMPITVDGSTQVVQDGVAGPALSLASIPVGQQVDIAGQPITADGAIIGDCTPPGSLDATLTTATTAYPTQPLNGLVRLQTNTAQGTLISSSAGTATITLQQLGLYAPANSPFTFDSATNPAAYAIDTGSLNLVNAAGQAASAGTVLTFTGNPATPGTAPPNFHASAVAPNRTELIVEWFTSPTGGGNPQGNPHPFQEVTATVNASPGPNLTIDKTNISRNVLKTGPVITDLSTLPAFPVIATKDGSTTFTVGNTNDGLFQYNDIASFEKEISTIMAASTSTAVLNFAKLVAQGQCSDANCSTFNATRVTLVAQ